MRTLAQLILLLLLPFSLEALDVPPLKAHVNDYAHMFSARTVQETERALADFEAKESTQIAVLTVPTLAGENLEEYSIKVAEAWKIGWKGLDSGVIVLIAEKERKIRIEVGRGLEGRLTDLTSGQIIRNEITPHFKTGDYDGGLSAGLGAIMTAVKGEYSPQMQKQDLHHARKSAPPIFGLLIFLFVALIFLGSMSKILGGVAGGLGLPLVGHIAFSGLPLIMLAGLGIAGLFMGLIVSLLFGGGYRSRGGTRTRGPFTGGGFWGGGFGGGGFGGGSGGGGFSGGGGSFGGGGSSGDW